MFGTLKIHFVFSLCERALFIARSLARSLPTEFVHHTLFANQKKQQKNKTIDVIPFVGVLLIC